jgi:hypothetical protein
MTRFLLAASGLAFLIAAAPVRAAEPPLELKLVAGKATYAWPYTAAPKEFDAHLQDLVARHKKKENVKFPDPPGIDLVLRITNTGKENRTIHVGGDPNQWTFTLKGPGVVEVVPRLAFTTDFRSAKPVVLEPGKSHDIPVKKLADGFRGGSRYLYPTAPGEYTLSATYLLAAGEGAKGETLTAAAIKITFEDKK